MTRTMYDSTNWGAIPTTVAMVAGYLPPSRYAWPQSAWDRFPGAVHVRIAVRATTNDGHVLDVEVGDATPEQAPGWVQMRRAAGADPAVYCSQSLWPTVRAAFAAAGVAEPHYWIAHYDGDPTIPSGAVAKQYADPNTSGGDWDLSAVADYWPGVDGGDMTIPLSEQQEMHDRIMGFQVQRYDSNGMPYRALDTGDGQLLVDKLDALATKVDALTANLSADEAALLTAIKAQPTGGQVDAHALAAALVPLLPPELSKADAQAAALAAVEQVFSKGATA